tara:strand:+ start:363 stop:569 length:207 start_codon:yes stop_codon:yes gene_type:complete
MEDDNYLTAIELSELIEIVRLNQSVANEEENEFWNRVVHKLRNTFPLADIDTVQDFDDDDDDLPADDV